MQHSCVEGGWPGFGNTNLDPQFVSPGTDNFRLDAASPCVDAGVNNAVPADLVDLDDDGNTFERLPLDLDLTPRFEDAPAADTGCGADAIVDMGAYEVAGIPVPHDVIPGDVNGDGIVDFADLLGVLAAWGPCDCCPADFDLDGDADFDDLLVVLANWTE